MHDKSQIISGFHAVTKALDRRLSSIQRLFFLPSLAPRFSSVCKEMAAQKKLYKSVPTEELERIAKTEHHGGVVAFFDEPEFNIPDENTLDEWKKESALIIALDGLGNPHNVGAVLRTAAFLGIKHCIIDERVFRFVNSGAVARTAEGGLEVVKIWLTRSLDDFLVGLHKDTYIIGTDQKSTRDLGVARQKSKGKPTILVMGNEETGMSAGVRAVCHDLIGIEGSGEIESLNVVQAASICMYVLSLPHAQAKEKPDSKSDSKPTKKIRVVRSKT